MLTKKIIPVLFIIIPALAGIIILFSACKNDLKQVQLLTDTTNYPDQKAENIDFYYSDSANLKLHVTAKELLRYSKTEIEPYIEFPKGINVLQFNVDKDTISSIKAKYAIYYQEQELWKAEKNVVAVNIDGDTLYTELLFWDTKQEKIYTTAYVKIITLDGEIFGKGMDANQDFTNWEIRQSTGVYYFDDDDI